MENEDFGFAKRSDNVMRKIHTVSNEQTNDNIIRNDEQRICSSSKVGFLFAQRIVILHVYFRINCLWSQLFQNTIIYDTIIYDTKYFY